MHKKINLTGQRFGYLVAVSPIYGKGNAKWLCKCDCGKEHFVKTGNLTNGSVKSCGCMRGAMIAERRARHNMANTNIYHEWQGMRSRCQNPRNASYKYYGERGIKVCNEWDKSFEAFYDYVSTLPDYGKPTYSIDRINNDGNYEPGNVRWASKRTQVLNRRRPTRRRKGIADAKGNTRQSKEN